MPESQTLIIPYAHTTNGTEYLLGYKNRGIFKGLRVFPGGKYDPEDENQFAAARRELLEETGVKAPSLSFLGKLSIEASKTGTDVYDVDIFATKIDKSAIITTPNDSDLSQPSWFRYDEIKPPIVPDDYSIWMPLARQIITRNMYGDTQDTTFQTSIQRFGSRDVDYLTVLKIGSDTFRYDGSAVIL